MMREMSDDSGSWSCLTSLKKKKKKRERNCEANGISNDVEVWS